jgi:hypothetical protein
MSNKRRVAEKNLGLFLNPGGAAGEGGYLVPMDDLNVGPGEPGPGDEWRVPTGPVETEADVDPRAGTPRPNSRPAAPSH